VIGPYLVTSARFFTPRVPLDERDKNMRAPPHFAVLFPFLWGGPYPQHPGVVRDPPLRGIPLSHSLPSYARLSPPATRLTVSCPLGILFEWSPRSYPNGNRFSFLVEFSTYLTTPLVTDHTLVVFFCLFHFLE